VKSAWFRFALLSVAAFALAAIPAAAQDIPAGEDFWRTPSDGTTSFFFPKGDVESLCGELPSDDWDHRIGLGGIPVIDAFDWDTRIRRLDVAKLASATTAKVRIQVNALQFRSLEPHRTPCGTLDWVVKNAGVQPVTTMQITRTSVAGGTFKAVIAVNVVFSGYDSNSGAHVGDLFYTFNLNEPIGSTGTPWSYGGPNVWRPGMTPADDCIAGLRKKLEGFPEESPHYYYISDMIAQGKCKRQG